MTALFLTILCSTSIALILKQNDSRDGEPVVLLSGNYFVAALIGGLFLISEEVIYFSYQTLFFGLFLGFLFVISFFAFARAVRAAGTAMATVSSRLSVFVPVFLSILFFREMPSIWQILGFLFTGITIILFYFSLRNHREKRLGWPDYLYLIGVLAGIGINDFCMKVFHHWRGEKEKPLFLFIIFLSAFLYTLSFVLIKRIQSDHGTKMLGGLLGIPNIFSSYFILSALAVLPGIIVYPVTNIGIILLTSFAAFLIWKEPVNKLGRWSLLTGIVSIVLLTIK